MSPISLRFSSSVTIGWCFHECHSEKCVRLPASLLSLCVNKSLLQILCEQRSMLHCCDYVPSYSIPFLHPNPPTPALNSTVIIGARLHHCGKQTFLNNSKQRIFDTDTNSIFLLSTIPLRKVTLKFLQIIDLVFDIIQGIYFWIASYYCM